MQGRFRKAQELCLRLKQRHPDDAEVLDKLVRLDTLVTDADARASERSSTWSASSRKLPAAESGSRSSWRGGSRAGDLRAGKGRESRGGSRPASERPAASQADELRAPGAEQ